MAVERHGDDTDHVAIGLGFAVEAGSPIVREALDYYEGQHYISEDGQSANFIIVTVLTDILRAHGLPEHIDEVTKVSGITIYPHDYFSPKRDGVITLSANTRTIHHYAASWRSPLYNHMQSIVTRLLGVKGKRLIASILHALGKKY